jgi:hypothetical protein
MIKKITLILLLITSLLASIYGACYYIAWMPYDAVTVQYVKDELIWINTEQGWIAKREPVVGVFYVYSCPNPDRGIDWLGFPNDRLSGYSYLKAYYNITDDARVKEATNLANQWLQTEEGKEAVEKVKKQFHKH